MVGLEGVARRLGYRMKGVHIRTLPFSSTRTPALAWLLLVLAVGVHVADEALNDFLALYNLAVEFLRDRFTAFSLPTLTFSGWLTALVSGLVILLFLTPLAHARGGGMRSVALFFSIFMIANGIGHLILSVFLGFIMPGAWSSPLLILAGINLFSVAKKHWSNFDVDVRS